ncbi:MAG TPA: hypothetical protein VD790_11660 [Thermoleophilaceae bacterium]|nr:hypothetical protein [Thermoleophilaceae bacterium]
MTALMAPAAAHAGYAHYEVRSGTIGDVIPRFNAGPGEKPDVSVQFVDFTTVLIEDRANPMVAGPPPTGLDGNVDPTSGEQRLLYENAQPCDVISTHVARCTAPAGLILREMEIDTGLLAARIRDVPGGVERPIHIFSGPLSDDIELHHFETTRVSDLGGNNRIRVGTPSGGFYEPTVFVAVGPGNSVINVRNGSGGDLVDCMSVRTASFGLPAIGGHVFADVGDVVQGCKNVQTG